MSEIHGAAQDNALMAWFGGGSIADGGAGKAGGKTALKIVASGAGVISASVTAAAAAEENRTKVKQHTATIRTSTAQVAREQALLEAIAKRADELRDLMISLRVRASQALDALESEPFDPGQHGDRLQVGLGLTRAVVDMLRTELYYNNLEITAEARNLVARYRPFTEGERS